MTEKDGITMKGSQRGQISGSSRPLSGQWRSPLTLGLKVILPALLITVLHGSVWGDDEIKQKAIRRSVTTEQRQPASLGKGDLYALAVGISDYTNPAVPKLNLSAKDAKDFADFIETQRKFSEIPTSS